MTTGTARSVVIVSAVNPYPADSGKKVVLSGLLDYWADRVGQQQVHYVLVRPASEPAANADFPAVLHRLSSPSTSRQLRSLAARTLTGRASIQEAMLYSPELGRQLAALLRELAADIEIFDTVRLGQYAQRLAPATGRRRIVYLDDLFSQRYEAMLTAAKEHGDVLVNPLGAFGTMIPPALRRPVDNRTVQRLLLKTESRLVGRAERAATRQFERCLLVNEREAQLLARQTGASNVAAVPPLVPTPAGTGRAFAGRPEFVFLGLLSLPHNDDGIRWFLDHAMAPLLARRPDAKVRVVGREATAALRRSATPFGDRVTLEGFVPDLDHLLTHAAALLTPLRFGSGVKIKLIEALARQLPVVSTSFGVDGIVDGPGQGVQVVDDVADFPAAMLELVDVATNRRVSEEARAHFDRAFSRSVVFAKYDAVF